MTGYGSAMPRNRSLHQTLFEWAEQDAFRSRAAEDA